MLWHHFFSAEPFLQSLEEVLIDLFNVGGGGAGRKTITKRERDGEKPFSHLTH